MLAEKLRAATWVRPLPTFVSSSFGSSNNDTTTVTAPSGIQDGDLLVAVVYCNAENRNATPPSGFSQVLFNSSSSTGASVSLTVKTASSESGNYTFTFSTNTENLCTILVYRNATRVNTLGSINSTGSGTTSGVANSITPTFAGVLCAAFFANNSTSVNSAPSGMTQRARPDSGDCDGAIYDLNPQSATATGNKTLVWNFPHGLTSWLFQITNEPTVSPEFIASARTQNTVFATSLTIDKPTGTAEGDLMVLVCAGAFGGSNDYTFPAGWTQAADLGSNTGLSIAYKTAGASEPSNYTVNATNNNYHAGSILTYRYAAYDTIGSFVTNVNPLILPSMTVTDSQSVLIAASARNSASITLGTPIGMTARVTDNDATGPSYIICDQPLPKGDTGTRSVTTGATTGVSGIMLSIKPTRSL